MKNIKKNKMIIFFILILLVALTISLYILIMLIDEVIPEERTGVITSNIVAVSPVKEKTVRSIVEDSGSTYIKRDRKKIYVNFEKDLYEEDGQSNEEYFENIVEEFKELEEFKEEPFSLIDEEKYVNIRVKYNVDTKEHTIVYNDMEDFFEKSNPENYCKVDNVDIIEKIELVPAASELSKLVNKKMFFNAIKNTIGEGTDLGNGFTSYKDNSILLNITNNKVKTIIFTDKYETEIFHGVKVGIDFEQLEKRFKGKASVSDKYGYAMYRTKDVYAFFYEDKIVIYGYSYYYHDEFEDALEDYINTRDLGALVDKVTRSWGNYEICEYDIESQYAHITYPSRGIEINIINNDPLGITLYNNYYFTNRTKILVKNGMISLNAEEDFIEATERKRIENFER